MKFFTKKRLFQGLGIIAAILLLGSLFGWFSGESKPTYETISLQDHTVRRTLSVVGSVQADKETTLAFEVGGTLKTIQVTEGQEVATGTVLAELTTNDIDLEIASKQTNITVEESTLNKLKAGLTPEEKSVLESSLAKAGTAATGVRSQIAATKQKNQEEIAVAELQVANAKTLVERMRSARQSIDEQDIQALQSLVDGTQRALERTRSSNLASVRNAEEGVRSAEQALQNAQNQQGANSPIADKNVRDAQETTFFDAANLLMEVDKTLRSLNEILTVEEYNKDQNKVYRDLLGVRKLNSYNNTLLAYTQLKAEFQQHRTLFIVTSGTLTYDEIMRRMDTLRSLLNKSYDTLSLMVDMLENTVTSRELTLTILDGFKSSILGQRNVVSTALQSLVSLRQTVENLELQKTSSTASLGGGVATAQRALEAAKQNLLLVQANNRATEQQAVNTLNQSIENLKKAKAGTLLTEVDILQLQQSAQEAEKNLIATKARIAQEEVTLNRNLLDAEAEVTRTARDNASRTAPARVEDVLIQQARLDTARLSLLQSEEKKRKMQLLAPRSGVISKVNFQPAEQVQAGTSVVVLINPLVDTITANIAETDIADVQIGQKVEFDFDAFTEAEIYEGTVAYISPDKLALDGVVYFATDVTFNPFVYLERIVRPGFSANLEIIVDERVTTALPNQVIRERTDGTAYVRVLKGEEEEEKQIEVGLRGDEYTEVISGIIPEDKVIVSSSDPK